MSSTIVWNCADCGRKRATEPDGTRKLKGDPSKPCELCRDWLHASPRWVTLTGAALTANTVSDVLKRVYGE